MKKKKGLVIINTGNGKGKTTAAFGLAARALGNGMKVYIRQFVKGKWKTGEIEFFKKFPEQIDIDIYGEGFIREITEEERKILSEGVKEHLRSVAEEMKNGSSDMIILDEIICLLDIGILTEVDILLLVDKKPKEKHLVLTGRGATERLIRTADIVTEMLEVKHPFKDGIVCQRGIEF